MNDGERPEVAQPAHLAPGEAEAPDGIARREILGHLGKLAALTPPMVVTMMLPQTQFPGSP